jgi:ABC-type multidrug transport system ATPase subunit/succinate dehydrogenase hydrophobic anchor subunit
MGVEHNPVAASSIKFLTGPMAGKIFPLTKPITAIGRDPGNDIVILDLSVSRFHALICWEQGAWSIENLSKTTGVSVNHCFVQRMILQHDNVISLGGGSSFVFLHLDAQTPAKPVPAQGLLSAYYAQAGQDRMQDGYCLVGLNSANHVDVHTPLVKDQSITMKDAICTTPSQSIDDYIKRAQVDENRSIRVDARGLKRTGSRNVILLNDISLVIPARSFVAIVGSSGTGKSTLMDALNGLRPAHEGMVLYNGEDYYRDPAAFSAQLGYVPQDNIVHNDLTVERALYYAARMRLPGDFTKQQIGQRIDEVLEDVEMMDQRAMLISKLSGGQRKRVSIALELLARPSIFFLDEPTSGLDPGLDRKMMFLLRRLADRGHTIVLATHITSNIAMCDYVCFLAQGGRMAYFGPPDEATRYFHTADFADIYSALEPTKANPLVAQEAEERFKTSFEYARYVMQPLHELHSVGDGEKPSRIVDKRKRGRHPWRQFLLLSMRYIELLKNDVGNLLILLLQAPIIALLLMGIVRYGIGPGVFNANNIVRCSSQVLTATGPLALPGTGSSVHPVDCSQVVSFLSNNPAGKAYAAQKGGERQALQDFIALSPASEAQKVLFLLIFAAILFGCVNGAREIVKEVPIYQRERAARLGIIPYICSKIVVLGTLSLLQSAVLTLGMNIVEPIQQGVFLPGLLEIYITLTLSSLAGLMMGLTLSAIASNSDRAISFVPIILIPQVLFAGVLIPFKDRFSQTVAASFPIRWALAASGSSVGLHSDKMMGDRLFGNDYIYHGTLFSIYSRADATSRILGSWLALLIIMLALTILTGLFLKGKHVRK